MVEKINLLTKNFIAMKKIFTLAVLFAAVSMVSCGCFQKKAECAETEAATECCGECAGECEKAEECCGECCGECAGECEKAEECCGECAEAAAEAPAEECCGECAAEEAPAEVVAE